MNLWYYVNWIGSILLTLVCVGVAWYFGYNALGDAIEIWAGRSYESWFHIFMLAMLCIVFLFAGFVVFCLTSPIPAVHTFAYGISAS